MMTQGPQDGRRGASQDDATLIERIRQLRALGATAPEVEAFVREHDGQRAAPVDATKLPVPPTSAPAGVPGGNTFTPQSTAYDGRTPAEAKDDPLRLFPGGPAASTLFGVAAGTAAGAGVAGPLAARLGAGLLARAATGAGASMAGGAASRFVTTPGGVAERAEAVVDPKAVAIDAGLGAGIPLAATGAAGLLRYLGADAKYATAKEVSTRLAEVAKMAGKSTDDVAREIESAAGRPLMVADLDRYQRALSAAAAKKSPVAERIFQDAVNARAGQTVEGAIQDIGDVTGHRVVDVAQRSAELRDALTAADAARFAFLQKDGGGIVDDPTVLRELRRLRKLFPEVEELAMRSARLDAAAAGVPFKGADLLEAPTLEQLHRIKQGLAQPEALAEMRAAAGRPLGKTDVRNVKRIASRFRQVLMKAYPRYSAAVEASHADRQVLDAIQAGQKAAGSRVSPATLTAERATAIGEARDPARVAAGHGEGVVGQVARDVRRRAPDALPGQRPSRAALDYLTKQDVRQKLAATTDDPARTLDELRRKLADRAAAQETDVLHTTGALEPGVVLGDERLGARLSGAFGEARSLGEMLSGRAPGGSLKLLVGALASKALQGRRTPALQAAADRIAGLLTRPVGPAAAAEYEDAVRLLAEFNRLRTRTASRVAAGYSGYRNAER